MSQLSTSTTFDDTPATLPTIPGNIEVVSARPPVSHADISDVGCIVDRMVFSPLVAKCLAALILTVVALGAATGPVKAQSASVQIGMLACSVTGNTASVFGGARDVDCYYTPVGSTRPQASYLGTLSNVGLDLGVHYVTTMTWGVVAPSDSNPVESLGGTYVGTTVSGSIGIGFGGNVLFGGSNNTVALQPVSIQAQTGLNASIGVVELSLSLNVENEEATFLQNDSDGWDAETQQGG